MDIAVTRNTSNSLSFSSGITRKLARNYYHSEPDLVSLFEKYPQKNGIAGTLPFSWINNINKLSLKEDKRFVIKDIYREFAKAVNIAKTSVSEATNVFNEIFHKYGIMPNDEFCTLKKVDTSGSVYTKNGYVLSYGKDDLFIKEFADLSDKSPKLYKFLTERNGKYVELARAFQCKNKIKDRHIMRTFWGDTKNGYMVSEYLKKDESSINIQEVYQNQEDLIKDLNKKYGIRNNEIKKYDVKIGYEYDGKFYSYPEDLIIYNFFSQMFQKFGLVHHDIYCNMENFITTVDKSGNRIIKLIDFGGISNK